MEQNVIKVRTTCLLKSARHWVLHKPMEAYIDSLIDLFATAAPEPSTKVRAAPALKAGKEKRKRCTKCKLELSLSSFGRRKDKLASRCKACVNAAQRVQVASGYARASKKQSQHRWARDNPDKIKAKQHRYQSTANRRAVERRKVDPNFRFASVMRNRINSALRGDIKSAPTLQLLGCDLDYLRAWIGSQFSGELRWDNYAKLWEFDHVRPCCGFDLTDPAQQKECFSWKNMRPMRCSPNRSKNGRPTTPQELESHQQLAAAWEALHPDTFTIHGKNLKD
jgi:hypothetical protein